MGIQQVNYEDMLDVFNDTNSMQRTKWELEPGKYTTTFISSFLFIFLRVPD